jgi:oxygen-independent coproporphyrinogen-3 oxidase
LKKNFTADPIQTIYFGGGTPSLLSPEELGEILTAARGSFMVNQDAEITLETNPDDVSQEHLRLLQHLGFNRISLGVQSFDRKVLDYLGRKHEVSQAEKALSLSLESFGNVSADLIFGVPGQSEQSLTKDLQKLIALKVPHISAYALTSEAHTPLAQWIAKGKTSGIDEDQMVVQFRQVLKTLTSSGYEHYEISNYALSGFRSIHNSNYWNRSNYIGLGPSAHSYNGKERHWNVSSLRSYITSIDKGELPITSEQIGPEQAFNEYILTAIRTVEGVDLELIEKEFGRARRNALWQEVQSFVAKNWLQVKDAKIGLTDEGKLFSDHITASLFTEK